MKKNKRFFNSKVSGQKGYRLHDERIAYSGGEGSIRTIKFPLKDADSNEGFQKQVVDGLISDHQHLYGVTNLADYINYKNKEVYYKNKEVYYKNKEVYSFTGLWLKCLENGILFGDSNFHEKEFKEYLGVEGVFEEYWNKLRNKKLYKKRKNKENSDI